MPLAPRRLIPAVLLLAALGGYSPAPADASPDFYGIRMNSENHARDLSPDELSLFPVRRGFDKNIYAYAHLNTAFNHTRSVTFNVFNNTDNDLFTEKSFREYYIVLRNGERYRLNEPGMSLSVDRIDARTSATLRADFGSLNVTREEIEMIVCSFDMGKVKIVLLPIVEEAPAPLPKEKAARAGPHPEKDPVPVVAEDKTKPRRSAEGPVVRTPAKSGRFPLMDWPVFSWMKGTSADPPRPSPIPDPKAETAPRTNISTRSPAVLAPLPALSSEAKAPAKKPSKGLFGAFFSMFEPREKSAASASGGGVKPASAARVAGEKEFFWKPRDLEPIPPIEEYKTGQTKEERPAPRSKPEKKEKTAETRKWKSLWPGSAPFYMKRPADPSVRIPADDPVTAVSAPVSKKKAPALKPEKKLRTVGPRTDAKVVQLNRQMGFIIVNAGAADGIRENAVFNIYRRGKVIAKAVVRKVKQDASAALLMKEWARENVAVGDPVSLY